MFNMSWLSEHRGGQGITWNRQGCIIFVYECSFSSARISTASSNATLQAQLGVSKQRESGEDTARCHRSSGLRERTDGVEQNTRRFLVKVPCTTTGETPRRFVSQCLAAKFCQRIIALCCCHEPTDFDVEFRCQGEERSQARVACPGSAHKKVWSPDAQGNLFLLRPRPRGNALKATAAQCDAHPALCNPGQGFKRFRVQQRSSPQTNSQSKFPWGGERERERDAQEIKRTCCCRQPGATKLRRN